MINELARKSVQWQEQKLAGPTRQRVFVVEEQEQNPVVVDLSRKMDVLLATLSRPPTCVHCGGDHNGKDCQAGTMGRKGKAKIVVENEAESEVEFDESLQAKYDPPFGLIDEREGILYDRFSKQDLATHVVVDQTFLSSLGLKKDFNEILKFHGWYRLATTQTLVYHNFTIEFLTTWKKELPLGGGKHSFRLNGKPYRLDATTLAALMGVYNHPEAISDFEKPITKDIAWEQLTGVSKFDSQTASPVALRDPLLNLVHKFVAHNLLGKNESNKVSKTELLILWCVANHKHVDNVKTVFEGFSSQTSRKRGSLASRLPRGLYIFGDSTFDVGTNNFLNIPNQLERANFPFYGIDFAFSIPSGRFSNGFNTADQIVKLLGYRRSPASFMELVVERRRNFKKLIIQGVNFASGGSGILDSTGMGVIPLSEQFRQFSTVRDNITEFMGPKNTAKMLSESVFLISVGSNDLFAYQHAQGASNNITQQHLYLQLLQQTYQTHLRHLYDLGGRKFGIVSIPPVGCCPFELSLSKSGECVKEMNDLAQSFFNLTHSILLNMTSQLEGMKFSLGNAYKITYDFIHNPLLFGFNEVKKACCGNGRFNGEMGCNTSASICSDRKDHLFWDSFHPTQAASKLAALTFFGGSKRYVTPMNFSRLFT
ncbi:GDSL esterase/lipase At5g55050-like [Euphorbia lathyris]|uniref:GDSL esterase/lipase At5g55050-like n=1 Tax=Euphorbia lathyris TaxID=212925 RepID=UPI0033139D19